MWQAVYTSVSDRPGALKWDHSNKPLLSSFWWHSHAAHQPEPLNAPWDLKGSLCALFSSSPLPFLTFFFLFYSFFCFSFQTSFHLVFIFLLKHGAPQTCSIGLSIFSIFCHGEKHLNLSLHLFITATFTHVSTHFSSSPPLRLWLCVLNNLCIREAPPFDVLHRHSPQGLSVLQWR